MTNIKIVPVSDARLLREFIRFPYQLYQSDPNWVPPLKKERRDFFNPRKNPFFKSGEAQLFLAMDQDRCLGRISAHVSHRHLELYKDAVGFFGFFDALHEPLVAHALVASAKEWLQSKRMQKMRGPFNFTINDEVGVLVEGFETPPSLMMTHNFPYYASLLEGTGLQKIKDLFAWHYTIGDPPEAAKQLAEATREYPGLEIRSFNKKEFDSEILLMMSLFNEVWAQNWGFVPMSEEEIRHAAGQLKQILDPEMALFVFVDKKPAAFSVCLPNINEAIRDLNGKLFPFGFLKLLWRLKKGLKSARLCLMGIRKPYRGGALGALSVLMNVESHRRGVQRGYQEGELSWTLEENERINKGIEFMGGRRYKTYRIYEKEL